MLHTRLCDLLGITHPIFNAPMAGAAGAALAAAVSAAGGFGLIGGSGGDPQWLRAQIRAVREQTNRPFGVGFISSALEVDALVQVALEERVAAIGHSFADPSPYVAAAPVAGVKARFAQFERLHAALSRVLGDACFAVSGCHNVFSLLRSWTPVRCRMGAAVWG